MSKDAIALKRNIIYYMKETLHALEKEVEEWEKDSQECHQNVGKKSPDEAQNVSTSSTELINTIPLRVPKRHQNVMLIVRENPLTHDVNLCYSYLDTTTGTWKALYIPLLKEFYVQ